MNIISDINVKDKKVLVRCDFNCPLDQEGNITDDFRIRRTLPTIEYLLKNGAAVILMSHLGDPKGEIIENLRLSNIQEKLFDYLDLSILKAPDCIGDNISKIAKDLFPGEILLLENLRFHKEEEKNDQGFAKKIASFGDVFVNDAFGASHRAHASIVGIPNYLPSYAGLLLDQEVRTLQGILENPKKPLVGIFGGVKIETKLPTIKKFLEIADYVLVGGKLAEQIDFIHPKLNTAVLTEDGFDIDQKTINKFKEIIQKAGTIVWNGPMGWFENEASEIGTKEIALSIARSYAFKVVGGGESLFAINKYNLTKEINFLSTGGGAMLEFLAGNELPGLKSLN
jgi:phosphoglycerate kinase